MISVGVASVSAEAGMGRAIIDAADSFALCGELCRATGPPYAQHVPG